MQRSLRPVLWSALAGLLAGAVVLAGGEMEPQGPDDPAFEVLEKPITARAHENRFDVSVGIENHPPVTIGRHSGPTGDSDLGQGIVSRSIRVRLLKGTPDLHLIEWFDFTQGSGGWQHHYYRISPAGDPSVVLVSGRVVTNGHGGWGHYNQGGYTASYRGDRLTITHSLWHSDTDRQPRPLYHLVPDKGDFYQTVQYTRVVRDFQIVAGQAKLAGATFCYQVQAGDRCEDVLSVFGLAPEWLSDDALPAAGEWLKADVPLGVAEDRWSTRLDPEP